MPGIAFHHGSKFACEGISENLGKRGGSFVIQVMVVEPYDPEKAASAMLTLIASDDPPAHLLLGRDAISSVRERLESLKTIFDT